MGLHTLPDRTSRFTHLKIPCPPAPLQAPAAVLVAMPWEDLGAAYPEGVAYPLPSLHTVEYEHATSGGARTAQV